MPMSQAVGDFPEEITGEFADLGAETLSTLWKGNAPCWPSPAEFWARGERKKALGFMRKAARLMISVPEEVRNILSDTLTEAGIRGLWSRPHERLGNRSPRELWEDGEEDRVLVFVRDVAYHLSEFSPS